jgi:hypothetical protein
MAKNEIHLKYIFLENSIASYNIFKLNIYSWIFTMEFSSESTGSKCQFNTNRRDYKISAERNP